jgi:hypothetical protein
METHDLGLAGIAQRLVDLADDQREVRLQAAAEGHSRLRLEAGSAEARVLKDTAKLLGIDAVTATDDLVQARELFRAVTLAVRREPRVGQALTAALVAINAGDSLRDGLEKLMKGIEND